MLIIMCCKYIVLAKQIYMYIHVCAYTHYVVSEQLICGCVLVNIALY